MVSSIHTHLDKFHMCVPQKVWNRVDCQRSEKKKIKNMQKVKEKHAFLNFMYACISSEKQMVNLPKTPPTTTKMQNWHMFIIYSHSHDCWVPRLGEIWSVYVFWVGPRGREFFCFHKLLFKVHITLCVYRDWQ